jgi:hypothetical protein
MIASNRATGGRGGDGYFIFTFTSGGYGVAGGAGGTAQGGGLYVNGSSLTIATSTMASNQGTGGPGGAYGGPGQGLGGGLYNVGRLTVTDSSLSGNSANSATSEYFAGGGGIYNSGTLTVSNSTLSGNSATGGGGIDNYSGTLTVSDSTLSGNTATYDYGGGIYNYNYGTLTVSNSTLSGNFAADGGGIFTNTALPVTLTNVTVTANRANSGGGLLVVFASSSPVLHNTLIAGNFRGATGTTRDDVFGALNPGGDYNLIGDGTGMTGLSSGVHGNLVGTAAAPIDPLLGPLQDNGGPTQTHALLPGSPAIDAGNNVHASMWDQRGPGFPRIIHGVIDIGAFEYRPPRQPQLDPNPAPVQGLSPPGPTDQRLFGPAEPVDVAPQESGGATAQPGQPDTTPSQPRCQALSPREMPSWKHGAIPWRTRWRGSEFGVWHVHAVPNTMGARAERMILALARKVVEGLAGCLA